MRNTLRAGLVILMLAGGCTQTTFRQSSLDSIRLEGRDLAVSWIWTGDDSVDLMVYEEPLWFGIPGPDMPRLNRALARNAAERVMERRCRFGGFHPVTAAATAGDDRYAFRYACGRQEGTGR